MTAIRDPRAAALQGQQAGIVSRALADLIDFGVAQAVFFGSILGVGLIRYVLGADRRLTTWQPSTLGVVAVQYVLLVLVFVLSSFLDNIAAALIDAVNKNNERNPDKLVLYMNTGAVDPALTNDKCSFWHFRFESHADMQLDVLTRYVARQSGVRKIYLINQDYAFGQAVSRTAKELLASRAAPPPRCGAARRGRPPSCRCR